MRAFYPPVGPRNPRKTLVVHFSKGGADGTGPWQDIHVPRRSPSHPALGPLPPTQPPAIGHHDRLIALLLLVICALAYHRAPAHQVYDWRYVTAVSHSLLHEGRLSLPRELLNHSKYRLQEIEGKVYHLFPAAPAVLNVPLLALYEGLGTSIYDETGRFDLSAERRVLRVGAALVTAGTVALLYLVARFFLGAGWAVPLTLVFAFGTSLFSTASRPYWSHAWAVFFLSLGMFCLLAPASRRPWLRDAVGATALSWSFFCRPPLALAVLALALFVVLGRRRRLLPLALVGGGWAALFVGHSVWVFGQLLPPYFGTAHASSGRLELAYLLRVNSEAALGTLFSPARGLFFFTPILLVILLALVWGWRALDRRQRRLAKLGLGVMLAHWHLVSSFRPWTGGASFGPRLFTDLLPWFLVLGAMAMGATLARAAAGARLGARRWAAVALLMTLASLFIHSRGATERLTTRHWGIWNWRFPPFMLGVIDYPDTPVPGSLVVYSANLDHNPRDGWSNAARRWGFELEMADGIGHRRLMAASGAMRRAFVFKGAGGGTMGPLQDLGGRTNVTEADATFEIWFRPARSGARRQVLFETGGRRSGVTVFVEAGRPGVGVRDGENATTVELISPEAVSRGELSQLAALLHVTEAGLELSLSVNGKRVAGPRVAPGVRDWAGGGGSGLGTAVNLPSLDAGEFHGEIALFRFYPAALEEKQLQRNLLARFGRRGSGLQRQHSPPPDRLP